MRTRTMAAALASAAILPLALLAAPASAEPPQESPDTLVCDNGVTYDIAINPGNGLWTPAFGTADTRVFIPLKFDGLEGAVYLAEDYPGGDPIASFDDPTIVVKPAMASGLRRLDCTFTLVDHEMDPELGELVLVTTGGVTVGVRR